MKSRYRDLVQFEQIQSVIQLRDAGRAGEAKKLISTYVISDDMAERIAGHLIPQLSFDESVDHKGVLVVGNYGTGKSHLMSVVSLIAEDPDSVQQLHHPKVAEAAAAVAGRFQVHRIEISSQMSLRNIITQELDAFLKERGIDYSFPPADQVVNNKSTFEEMMAKFTERFPDQGVLLVVDEFLDYLRSRNEHELVHDLMFLRELGEVARHLRFRFLAGVQESLFDSGRFEFVADSLRRVKDRFTDFRLVKQDVSYVVAERLLKKTAEQQNRIRDHLKPFISSYGLMNERLDEYVRLFPVHPDYIDTFEQLVFTEKRGALETLQNQMQKILDQELPEDHPGLISYDSFWETVRSNQVLRADPNIKPVIKVAEVLSERVSKGFTRPAYTQIAHRIINALSVHRLTTGGDLYTPVGPAARELRDSLCLFHPEAAKMGGEPADNLLTVIQTTLREITKTVNGQFISRTPDTEQYYLDLKKDVNYEALIEQKAESLSDEQLDRGYYDAMKRLMECADVTYASGHRIWQHQIEWHTHRAGRNGYLFFGAPNDRPTAQPERDFYIYFIQPFDPPRFKDETKSDEVFFRLKESDDTFRKTLSLYAAALDLAAVSSANSKTVYQGEAEVSLRKMSEWLQEKQMTAYEVSCRGETRTLQEWTKGISLRDRAGIAPDERINFRDVVNGIAGHVLASHFAELAPDYPKFSSLVTESNRKQLIGAALSALAGGRLTEEASIVLDALEMLADGHIDPSGSRYANKVLSRLHAKNGQVLNRSELLSGAVGVEYFDSFRLEPDLLVVLLGGLIHSGHLVLSIAGHKVDPTNMSLLTEKSLDDLQQFKHAEQPKGINLPLLKDFFKLLGLAPGLAEQIANDSDEPVKQLQEKVSSLTGRALEAATDIKGQLTLWGQALLKDEEIADWKNQLSLLKDFSDGLTRYNTPGKLKNLRMDEAEIKQQKQHLKTLKNLESKRKLVIQVGPVVSYLSRAETILPAKDPWQARAKEIRRQLLDELGEARSVQSVGSYREMLAQLKQDYIAAYTARHTRERLNARETVVRDDLKKDPRLLAMRGLSEISLMPGSQMSSFEARLDGLVDCPSLLESELETSPVCPHCDFRPGYLYVGQEGSQNPSEGHLPVVNTPPPQIRETGHKPPVSALLEQLNRELDQLIDSWQTSLLNNLKDPFVQEKFDLLKPAARNQLDAFVASGSLPDPVAPEFVAAVQEALSDLDKITIRKDEISTLLFSGGAPATPEELHQRFETFLSDRCKGRDPARVRFVLE